MHADCKSMQSKIKEEVNPLLPFHHLKLGLIYSQCHTILDVVDEHDQKQIPKIDPQTGRCESCGQVLLLLSECVAPFFALGLRPNAASKLPTLLRNRVKRVRFALRVTELRWFGWGFRVTAEFRDSSDVCSFLSCFCERVLFTIQKAHDCPSGVCCACFAWT